MARAQGHYDCNSPHFNVTSSSSCSVFRPRLPILTPSKTCFTCHNFEIRKEQSVFYNDIPFSKTNRCFVYQTSFVSDFFLGGRGCFWAGWLKA